MAWEATPSARNVQLPVSLHVLGVANRLNGSMAVLSREDTVSLCRFSCLPAFLIAELEALPQDILPVDAPLCTLLVSLICRAFEVDKNVFSATYEGGRLLSALESLKERLQTNLEERQVLFMVDEIIKRTRELMEKEKEERKRKAAAEAAFSPRRSGSSAGVPIPSDSSAGVPIPSDSSAGVPIPSESSAGVPFSLLGSLQRAAKRTLERTADLVSETLNFPFGRGGRKERRREAQDSRRQGDAAPEGNETEQRE